MAGEALELPACLKIPKREAACASIKQYALVFWHTSENPVVLIANDYIDFLSAQIPETKSVIVGCGNGRLAIAHDGDRAHAIHVILGGRRFLDASNVPKLQGSVIGTGDSGVTVGRQGDAVHPIGMPFEYQLRFVRQIPYMHLAVIGAGNRTASIGAERSATNPLRFPRQDLRLPSSRFPPEKSGAILRNGKDQLRSASGHCCETRRMTFENGRTTAIGCPKSNGSIA